MSETIKMLQRMRVNIGDTESQLRKDRQATIDHIDQLTDFLRHVEHELCEANKDIQFLMDVENGVVKINYDRLDEINRSYHLEEDL